MRQSKRISTRLSTSRFVSITFFFVFSLFLLGVFLNSFFMVSYLLGREFHWRRSFFQNQTKHQTYKATRRLCQQSGKRCRQYPVSFSFFYNLILLSIMDPCTRDLLLDRSKKLFYDISITHYFSSLFFSFPFF